MKKTRITILFLMLSMLVSSQNQQTVDSLKNVLPTIKNNVIEKSAILLSLTDEL